MRTEIPNIAADIKNLNLRVSNKFLKSAALVRQSRHEKQKVKSQQSLISDKEVLVEGNNVPDLPLRNSEV